MTHELFKTHPAMIALAAFIFHEYPKRDYKFATSWSTYAICSTAEEDLVNAAFYAEEQIKNPSFNPDVDPLDLNYLRDLPTLVLNLCICHAKSETDISAAKTFVADAMSDLMQCHLSEMLDMEFADA